MPQETKSTTSLWLLLLLATSHTTSADSSEYGHHHHHHHNHHVAPLPAFFPRIALGVSDAVSPSVDTAVCLTSSSSSSTSTSSTTTAAAAATALLNSSRTRRQPTNEEDDQFPVGLGHEDDAAARHAEDSVPAPWVKGNCRRGSVLSTEKSTATRQGREQIEYCAYTHPSFNNGMGLSVITTKKRLDTMANRSVFGGDKDKDGAASTSTHKRADWPLDNDPVFVPAWSEQNIPGKDVGLLASRPIRRGERIMARTPAVMIDGAAVDALPVAAFAGLLHDAAASLPEPHRGQFFNLSTNYGSNGKDVNENEAYQIFATNAFRTGIADGEPDLHSVFRDVSRINHGCQPNCAYFFDPATLTHNVYAVVDIMQGEELTVAYIDPIQTHADRQAKLHRHWGFGCTCARCSLPPHRVAESDDRVRFIQALLGTLDDYSIPLPDAERAANVTVGPSAGELLVLLFELEGLHARMHEAEYRLALEWNGIGDALRATQAARRCLDRGLLVRGAEQAFLTNMRALVANPAAHWSWRFRLGNAEKKKREEEGGEKGDGSDNKK